MLIGRVKNSDFHFILDKINGRLPRLEKQYFYCRFVHEHYVFIVNFDHGYLIVPRTSVIRENPVKISIVNTHFPFSIFHFPFDFI